MRKERNRPERTKFSGIPEEKCPLVGREKALQELAFHVGNGQSLHICGPSGVGKTAFLDMACDNWPKIMDKAPVPLYCRSSRTLREILISLAAALLDRFKYLELHNPERTKRIDSASDINRLNITALEMLVCSQLPRDRFCVILDHLECVTPRINSFLTLLYEKTLVISASRQSWDLTDYAFKGNFDCHLFLIPKLAIKNLSRDDAVALMERAGGETFMGTRRLFEEIYRITKGNAGLTEKIILRAHMPKYHISGYPNLKLIQIDLDIGAIIGS